MFFDFETKTLHVKVALVRNQFKSTHWDALFRLISGLFQNYTCEAESISCVCRPSSICFTELFCVYFLQKNIASI